jgi:hypothetical protein
VLRVRDPAADTAHLKLVKRIEHVPWSADDRGQYSHAKEYLRNRWLWSELRPCNVRNVSRWKILHGRCWPSEVVFWLARPIISTNSSGRHRRHNGTTPDLSASAKYRRATLGYSLPLDCFRCHHRPASFMTCPTSQSIILWLQRCPHQRKLGQLSKLLH